MDNNITILNTLKKKLLTDTNEIEETGGENCVFT